MIRQSQLTNLFPKVELGEVVEFLDHLRKPVTKKDRVFGPYPYYGANGQQDSVNGYIFDEPLVLLAEDGGYFGDPSRTIAYQVEGKCWVNNHAHVLRPSKRIDIRYLCRHLEKYDVVSSVNGATRAKLNKTAAQSILISLPPLAEQKRIAAILDKADAIRRKREKAIALTDDLLRSVFLDMFGDPVTNPKGWEIKELREIAHIQIGPFGTQLHKEDYITGGIPLINPKNIINGRIHPNYKISISRDKYMTLSEYHLKLGDIILARRGEMGRCSVITENESGWFCGTGSLIIRPYESGNISLYLNKLISSHSIKSQLENACLGAIMPNLNKSIVGSIKIPVPDPRVLSDYVLISDKMFDLIDNIKRQNFHYFFSSLSQSVFSGELTRYDRIAQEVG